MASSPDTVQKRLCQAVMKETTGAAATGTWGPRWNGSQHPICEDCAGGGSTNHIPGVGEHVPTEDKNWMVIDYVTDPVRQEDLDTQPFEVVIDKTPHQLCQIKTSLKQRGLQWSVWNQGWDTPDKRIPVTRSYFRCCEDDLNLLFIFPFFLLGCFTFLYKKNQTNHKTLRKFSFPCNYFHFCKHRGSKQRQKKGLPSFVSSMHFNWKPEHLTCTSCQRRSSELNSRYGKQES